MKPTPRTPGKKRELAHLRAEEAEARSERRRVPRPIVKRSRGPQGLLNALKAVDRMIAAEEENQGIRFGKMTKKGIFLDDGGPAPAGGIWT